MTETHVQNRSSTAIVLEELQLYGWRPFTDEPDPQTLPDPNAIRSAVADIFDALVSTLSDTRLEPDLEDLLWSTTNLFQRTGSDLDTNEQAQKRSQREQEGSEVRSVELETLIAEGITLLERRNSYEAMRDLAADLFETHLGQTWHPRSGSHVNRRTMTASLTDSRDHLAAKRRADLEPLLPNGTKIAFGGGLDCNDHTAIWAALDRVHPKHADMVLLHGGAPRGAERIAGFAGEPTINDAMSVVLGALALLALGIFGPGIANGIVSGGPQLGAGAAVGSGIAVGGAAITGAAGTRMALGTVGSGLRVASAVGSGTTTAYQLGAASRSTALGKSVGGVAAVGKTGAVAAFSPLRSAISDGAGTGARTAYAAKGGRFAGSTMPAPANDGPPDWARRMQRQQSLQHGLSTAAHALRSGDHGGGGTVVSLSERSS